MYQAWGLAQPPRATQAFTQGHKLGTCGHQEHRRQKLWSPPAATSQAWVRHSGDRPEVQVLSRARRAGRRRGRLRVGDNCRSCAARGASGATRRRVIAPTPRRRLAAPAQLWPTGAQAAGVLHTAQRKPQVPRQRQHWPLHCGLPHAWHTRPHISTCLCVCLLKLQSELN